MRRFLCLAFLLFVSSAQAAELTTVILVRHGEKTVADAGMSSDVPLSAAGEKRAKELARLLADAGITTIYTTPYIRTRNTAAPIAAALKLTPVEIKTGPAYAAEMADLIQKHKGETILVVGHSNTTRDVMKQLGVANAPDIADAEYDNLFIVTIAEGSAPRMVRLRYGD